MFRTLFPKMIHFWKCYNRHFELLRCPFELVIEDFRILEDLRNRKHRSHYVFVCFFASLFILDTLVQYSIHGYDRKNRIFFLHMIISFMPEMFVEQGDIAFNLFLIETIMVYYFLSTGNFTHVEFVYHFRADRLTLPYRKFRTLEPGLERQLIRFYFRYKRKLQIAYLLFLSLASATVGLPLLCSVLYEVYLTNFRDLPSVRTVIVIIVCPFILRYMNGTIFIGVQFMLTNRFIQTKQRYHTRRVESLVRQNYWGNYRKCQKVLNRILDLTTEIERMNCFYRKYNTLTIFAYGISGIVIFHATSQKASEAGVYFTILWLQYATFFLTYTLLISFHSSRTIYMNLKLFKTLRNLQTNLLSGKCLTFYQIVKLDLINEYRQLLQKCSFRLSTNAVINNRCFAFTFITFGGIVYMKLLAGKLFEI